MVYLARWSRRAVFSVRLGGRRLLMCERRRPCSFLERGGLVLAMRLDSLGSTRLFELTRFFSDRGGLMIRISAHVPLPDATVKYERPENLQDLA
jgi:hypothetical protein